MSAIAARRAAALLASQNASPSSSALSTPVKAQSPILESEVDLEESESESSTSSATPPPSPPKSTSKRRKLHRSSQSGAYDDAPQRALEYNHPITVPISKRTRRFSPSAPASILEPESESDSSVGNIDADIAEDEDDDAINEVEEGKAQWTLPTTSVQSMPGPSRAKSKSGPQDHTSNTSIFSPVEGVNMYRVSESDLRIAGLDNDYAGDGIILSLSEDETMLIAGTYILTPLAGIITISSCKLSADGTSYPVFAPTSHPIPVIEPYHTSTKRPSAPFLNALKLPVGFRKNGSMIMIRENQCGIDGLRYGAVPGFANIWLEEVGSWGLRGIHPIIGSISTPIYPHIAPPTWSQALSSLPSTASPDEYGDVQEPYVGLVKGPKRSGKSTFARALTNNLLERYERVAWLECDLGQGEFSPGGVVGLWVLEKQVIGPPFTHPLNPYRAHYLGTYTPLTCPDQYIASLRHLMEIYKFDVQHSSDFLQSKTGKLSDTIPLVINTQGWIKGLGEELLKSIENICQPNYTYFFNSPFEEEKEIKEIVKVGGGWTNSPTFEFSNLPNDNDNFLFNSNKQIKLNSINSTALQLKYSSTDFRILSIISYFHISSFFNENENEKIKKIKWNFNKPLINFNPWEIEFGLNKIIKKIYIIGESSEGILKEDLNLSLNGSIVGLIEILNNNSFDEQEQEQEKEKNEKIFENENELKSLNSINFLGLGLIRFIETTTKTNENENQIKGKLHLITPLSNNLLLKCNGLIKNGSIELPTPALLNWFGSKAGFEINKNEFNFNFNEFEQNQNQIQNQIENVPFFDFSGIQVIGGERRKFRKNLMRKGM
ncbi:uncharacterized protein I206_104877 [Kwoniella pini CBS 10737]|uniref:Polynucleotide 5'-hydroxyl-kinase GRC3 n=1 Tax=Kwoniella pini CBS 10737 TaxID=1296096 RepID=A0A1B9I7Z4_9TREE|nr:uncharacterized protein I206_02417 [Kwoniella pini CBS 10737]OCF51702.1 hypothetical protein I206_02417 [Kwoniella pini CBS 10737]